MYCTRTLAINVVQRFEDGACMAACVVCCRSKKVTGSAWAEEEDDELKTLYDEYQHRDKQQEPGEYMY